MQDLKETIKYPDIKKKIWITVLILGLFMLLTLVPIPGAVHSQIREIAQGWGDTGILLNVLSAGGLYNGSVLSLGIYPYLIGSMAAQILIIAVPSLRALAQMGDAGSKKVGKISRIVSLVMGLVLSVLLTLGLRTAVSPSINFWFGIVLIGLSLTIGSAVSVFLAELLNSKGIGNGMTILLTAVLLRNIYDLLKGLYTGAGSVFGIGGAIGFTALAAVLAAAIIVFLVYVMLGERKISFLFSKRTIGMKQMQGQNSTLPIKISQAGVIPVVYALTICSLPAIIVVFSTTGFEDNFIIHAFRYIGKSPLYLFMFLIFLVFFNAIFSIMQLNPMEISKELKANGGYIPGVKPGMPTQIFLSKLYNNMNYAGNVLITVVCVIPMALSFIPGLEALWYVGITLFVLAGGILECFQVLDMSAQKLAEAEKPKKKLKTGKAMY